MYDREVHKGKINKKDNVSRVKICLVSVRKSWNTKNQVYLSIRLLPGSVSSEWLVTYGGDGQLPQGCSGEWDGFYPCNIINLSWA